VQIMEGVSHDGSEHSTISGFEWVCKNDGKTPAWITGQQLWCKIFHEAPAALPDTTLPVSFSRIGPHPLSVRGAPLEIPMELVCEGRREPIGGGPMVIYGVVKYRDVFGGHETWCGYIIMGPCEVPRLERLAGYPEYNKTT
jgi:hypothetical protein